MIEVAHLIYSIKQGDQSALQTLYKNYADALYGIVFRIIKREAEAEEVLQNVFIKVWNNIESYNENKATIFTWMAQIAKNAALDMRRLKSFEIADKTSDISTMDYSLTSDQRESGIDIAKLIKDLPEKYRILLDKMFLEGYTQQEISDELAIPLGTVKTRLRDAIQILRDTLKDEKHLLYLLNLLG